MALSFEDQHNLSKVSSSLIDSKNLKMQLQNETFTSDTKSEKMDEITTQLEKLPLDDLINLLDDSRKSDESIESIISKSNKIQRLHKVRSTYSRYVREKAESNLYQKPQYCNDRNLLLEILNETKTIRNEIEDTALGVIQRETMKSVDSLHAIILVATSEAEEDSEMLTQSFLNGYTPCDIFVEEIVEKRKLVHLRRSIAEKLADNHKLKSGIGSILKNRDIKDNNRSNFFV